VYHLADVPTADVLLAAMAIFLAGLMGVLVRRDLFFVLISLEVMLSATALAFVAAAARWGQPEGQVMVILILVFAAAEVGVGISFLLRIHQHTDSVDGDRVSRMKG